MFEIFTRKKEFDEVNKVFEQGGAYLNYILITCLERNMDYFEENFTSWEKVTNLLDRGMSFAEKGDHRVAYIHFREGLEYISSEHQDVIKNDKDLLDSVVQAMEYEKVEVNPIWLAYKEKYEQ